MLARLDAERARAALVPARRAREAGRARDRARAHDCPSPTRRESQDLCFLAGIGPRRFLDERLGRAAARRESSTSAARSIGRHGGQHRFTVGQRRGIGVAAAEPLYVLAKDAGERTRHGRPAEVARAHSSRHSSARCSTARRRWSTASSCATARARSPAVSRGSPAREDTPASSSLSTSRSDAVAPGQTACLMREDSVIGCGVIVDRMADPNPMLRTSVTGSS